MLDIFYSFCMESSPIQSKDTKLTAHIYFYILKMFPIRRAEYTTDWGKTENYWSIITQDCDAEKFYSIRWLGKQHRTKQNNNNNMIIITKQHQWQRTLFNRRSIKQKKKKKQNKKNNGNSRIFLKDFPFNVDEQTTAHYMPS